MRRGIGSDVAGSRLYQPGDDVDKIDWHASAKLSLARGSEEFIVREHYAEEAPRVVVLCDRRPSMSIFDDTWPWLSKPRAIREAATVIGDSAVAARGLLGYFDEGDGDAYWHPPRSTHQLGPVDLDRPFDATERTLARGLAYLVEQRRDLPAGTFVFVLSDFLEQPTRDEWIRALERRWELVPVIIQDPIWEQSFPDVSGIVVSLRDPETGRIVPVRLRRKEIAARRRANEERFAALVQSFRELDLDPVIVSSNDKAELLEAFLGWSELRRIRRVVGA
jgi:uncharacterized protein (DUF58 family)